MEDGVGVGEGEREGEGGQRFWSLMMTDGRKMLGGIHRVKLRVKWIWENGKKAGMG